jgi:peptidoglycan/xylan/chitin deacetylase (PgdA/CDA1 family)
MDLKFGGLALLALVGFISCHNFLRKDKAKKETLQQDEKDVATTTVVAAAKDSVKADTALRYVYLTFDDGPQPGTMNCYRLLKQKGIKGTFFMIGEHAEEKFGQKVLDTMNMDMRHMLIANHSYTHGDHNRYQTFYSTPTKALNDFIKTHDTLELSVPIARFPANNSWVVNEKIRATNLTKPLAKAMDSVGYDVLGWDVEWRFNKKNEPIQSAEAMAAEVMNALNNNETFTKHHVVLLAHDRMFKHQAYSDSLAKMISILQSHPQNVFETADQYPNIKKSNEHLALAKRK